MNQNSDPLLERKKTANRNQIFTVCFIPLLLLAALVFTFRFIVPSFITSDSYDFASVIGSFWRKPFDLESFLQNPSSYEGQLVIELNNNQPLFTRDELKDIHDVVFSDLDSQGRCGAAIAYLGPETIPTEKRDPIGMVKPSGWHTARYDNIIEDKYLYNRCHLIGYQLSGQNADMRNLITGTRYMNMSGMLPYENMVFNYIVTTGNHVLYRVTPVFLDDDLLASGVIMEAYSIEDHGQGVSFCIYTYNVQPGIVIDYLSGDSRADDTEWQDQTGSDGMISLMQETEYPNIPVDRLSSNGEPNAEITYILNTNTKRFHNPTCPSVQETKEKNRMNFYGSREEVIAEGYIPCGRCKP